MTSAAPNFCVIIATHGRPALLERAVRSVHAQSWPANQLIVVSDMADPASHQTVSALMHPGDLFIERRGTPGPSESRNIGLALVQSDYFLFLDDDDSFAPDFLANCAGLLSGRSHESSELPCYFTNFEVVHELQEGDTLRVTASNQADLAGFEPGQAYVKNFVPNNCVLYPRRLASEIRFDPAIPYEDWDFMLCAGDRVPLMHLPVYGPKIHKNASTEHQQRGKANESSLLQCYLSVYGKHPAPNPQIAVRRQELFASLGLNLDALLQGAESTP